MAVRWGAGEETLTACNMEFLPLDTLDETAGLNSGDTMEALQSCLDPTILSMFEDTPTIETKRLDEESEATLLTALTEILDNVDDENLSPFDMLPDSDLLSAQKGRELSPGLPRIHPASLQRSDGEEEEDGSLALSPGSLYSSPDNGLLEWDGLPITFEQEGVDTVSVSLGELVRHMHSYCMTICVGDDEREQMLPEGGILLEVVDQGENGEPILAIPDMALPVSVQLEELFPENEKKLSEELKKVVSDSSEHIVVDDEDINVHEAPSKTTAPATPDLCLDVKYEMSVKRQKEEIKGKSPSRRKKKKRDEKQFQPEVVEGQVLQSASVKKEVQETLQKTEKSLHKEEAESKVPQTLSATAAATTSKPKMVNKNQTETQPYATTTTVLTSGLSQENKVLLKASTNVAQTSDLVVSLQNPEKSKQSVPASEKLEDTLSVPSAALASTNTHPVSSGGQTAAPSPVSVVSGAPLAPKPKSLSLAEYRRLRQQKKPTAVEKWDNHSTKWPSLPELPKELPPIPCLPYPNPRDPRSTQHHPAKKEVEEVKAAWQPRGPNAPPTPEALLVPPAYMITSSNNLSAATQVSKPRQTPEPRTALPPKPSQSQNQPPAAPSSVKKQQTQTATAHPAVPSVPQVSPPATMQRALESPASLGEKDDHLDNQPVSPKSVDLHSCTTTTETVKPTTVSTHSAPPKTTTSPNVPKVTNSASLNLPSNRKPSIPTDSSSQFFPSAAPPVLESQSLQPERTPAPSPTQELIESFTSEIGIEAADLTSLLEQFEETQAKEEHCVPEVSGRAAAVGNSSGDVAPENTAVERVRTHDLSSTAALTPPATPPHHTWKPLAPVALLGKSKAAEKSSPSKVIQIEARPLPSAKIRTKPTLAGATVASDLACMDHDYCLPNKATPTGEPGKRWNVKRQSSITIKPIKQPTTPTSQEAARGVMAHSVRSTTSLPVAAKTKDFPLTKPLDQRTHDMERTSVLETPDASPARQDTDTTLGEGNPKRGPFGRSYRRHTTSRTPSPRSGSKERTGGRSKKRRSRRSPMSSASESDSHSSSSRSRSRSPSKKRYRHRHSESSSSSSPSSSRSSLSVSRSPPRRRRRYSYSSSRSGSWSRSRSRSPSQTQSQWSRNRRLYSPSYRPVCGWSANANADVKRRKEKAIEERRVVYVGRIRGTMTQKELRERFSLFGEIEECTLHFRDHGDNYGFVTYYNTDHAFTAIEKGSKLRKPDELPFDVCFGGRRQFCQATYADLDSSREYEPLPTRGRFDALDFDTLLKQAQQKLKR